MPLPAPHVLVVVEPALTGSTTVAIELELDGGTEQCSLSVGATSGAQSVDDSVAGPATETATDCTLIEIAGIDEAGTVSRLRIPGEHERLTLQATAAGVDLGRVQTELEYTDSHPHGAHCGAVSVATVKLTAPNRATPAAAERGNIVSMLGASEEEMRSCAVDSDCVTSCRSDGNCCWTGCNCNTVYNTSFLARLEAHQAGCTMAGCVKLKCADPGYSWVGVCREGMCEAVKLPH